MPHALRRLVFVLLLGAPVVGAGAEPPPGERPGWTWVVTPSADLARIHVRLCFRDFRPKSLNLPLEAGRAGMRPGSKREGTVTLEPAGQGWVLDDPLGQASPCVEYEVEVGALVSAGVAERIGDDLVTEPGAWMLLPGYFTPAEDVRVVLALPEGQRASVPWPQRAPGEYTIASTAFVFESRVAFGRFVPRPLEVAGARFELAVLDAPHRASDAGIDRWIRAAGEAVAGLYAGRFPAPRVQVLIQPVRPSGEPVVFGRSMPSGGACVLLYLSASAANEDLPLEWIAVHELTHVGMPWIVSDDAWLNEGFVTYYQEVLRGRVGYFGENGPWRALEEGFARGRRWPSDRSIAEDSRTMHARHAYHRVYWAGAALALRVDLALRAETGGRRSLDDVMRLWATEPFAGRLRGRALDLLAEADRVFGTRACVASVRGPLASAEFPATDDLYAALGLTRGPEGLQQSNLPASRALRAAVGGPAPRPSRGAGR